MITVLLKYTSRKPLMPIAPEWNAAFRLNAQKSHQLAPEAFPSDPPSKKSQGPFPNRQEHAFEHFPKRVHPQVESTV